MAQLTQKDLAKFPEIESWEFKNNSIEKNFEKKDFSEAVAFVVQIGIAADKADHHPDIYLHSWNKVKVTLSTHDEGGVTDKDVSLAKTIENL